MASKRNKAGQVVRGTEAVLLHHMEAIDAGDMDAVMADYATDAVLMTDRGTFRGRSAIRRQIEKVVREVFAACTDFKMIRQAVDGEVAMIVWSAETKRVRVPFACDTFVVRGGKIVAQTFAMNKEILKAEG